MNSYIFQVGQRVKTRQFGWGTIIAFESLGWHRATITDRYQPDDRIVVQLDEPERWILSAPDVHPHMFPSDFACIMAISTFDKLSENNTK